MTTTPREVWEDEHTHTHTHTHTHSHKRTHTHTQTHIHRHTPGGRSGRLLLWVWRSWCSWFSHRPTGLDDPLVAPGVVDWHTLLPHTVGDSPAQYTLSPAGFYSTVRCVVPCIVIICIVVPDRLVFLALVFFYWLCFPNYFSIGVFCFAFLTSPVTRLSHDPHLYVCAWMCVYFLFIFLSFLLYFGFVFYYFVFNHLLAQGTHRLGQVWNRLKSDSL